MATETKLDSLATLKGGVSLSPELMKKKGFKLPKKKRSMIQSCPKDDQLGETNSVIPPYLYLSAAYLYQYLKHARKYHTKPPKTL